MANIRPPYSYIYLVFNAIRNHPTRSPTLDEIISSIEHRFVYYRRTNSTSWKQNIRRTLTLTFPFYGWAYCHPTDNRWRLTVHSDGG
jgi:hypothetical protein